MRTGRFGVVAVCFLIVACLAVAGIGFVISIRLNGPGENGSASGTQDLGWPYNHFAVTASDLREEILLDGATGVSISRFNSQTDGFITYSGLLLENDFFLTPAEGYRVRVTTGTIYVIAGSHDPGLVVNLDGPGTNGSRSGSHLFAPPYHAVVTQASDLRDDILAQANPGIDVSVSRLEPTTDGLVTYAGFVEGNNFEITPGESYIVKTTGDVPYVPTHF